MQKKYRTSGFTLIEVLVSVMLSGMILTSAYSAFQGIMKSEVKLGGVIDIQRSLFYLNEKLAYLIHNGGTIDYEEYFNRRMLGYARGWVSDVSNTEGRSVEPIFTFSTLSHYGNGDGVTRPTVYVCGKDATIDTDACLGVKAVGNSVKSGFLPTFNEQLYNTSHPKQQAYRQYRELAFNYASFLPVPTKLPSVFPSSTGPLGLLSQEGLPELYLIKKLPDGSYERIYFRHVLVQDPVKDKTTMPCDPTDTKKIYNCLGKIQTTRLKSCDILNSDGTRNAQDGTVDVWIPEKDFSKTATFDCEQITDYSKATDDLLWIDLSTPDMNITKALFLPSPEKIPSLMAGTGEEAVSPVVQIRLEVKLSGELLRRGLLNEESNTPRTMITTFDLAD